MTRELLVAAVQSMAAHRLQSVLAVAGIVAGVATVVSVLAIAEGAKAQALADIGSLGIDNIRVRAASAIDTDPRARRKASALRLEDAVALSRVFAGATIAARRTVADEVTAADVRTSAAVDGVTAAWQQADQVAVAHGRWFGDVEERDRVAVVGYEMAATLFGTGEPLGRRMFAAGEFRVVIGVASRGQAVFVPIGSLDVSTGTGDEGDAVDEIVVHLPRGSSTSSGAAAASAVLASRHDPASFAVVVPEELLQAKLRAQRTSQILMLAIGVVSMLISGVGIMNIMLASVAARGPEIGLRRAVGATRRAILAQFALEAAVLSGAGGLAGLPLGALAAAVVAVLASWPVVLTAASLGVALALAILVGLAAGVYPARLAASMSPTDAMAGRLRPSETFIAPVHYRAEPSR